jgi:microcystin degradation protein MlrC
MAALETVAREFERSNPDFLSVDVLAGFAYADVPDTGVSFTISTTGPVEDADLALGTLCTQAWELCGPRESNNPDVRSVLESLRAHFPPGSGPVLLEEPSDNIGGGAPGDTTELLAALLEFDLPGSAAVINDPQAVQSLNGVAVGASVRLAIGGKSGAVGATQPVPVDVVLLSRSDGRFDLEDPTSHLASMGTRSVDMGPCVVLGVRNTRILVTSHKTPPFDLAQWRSQGIAPEDLRVVGIKAAVAHRKAWDPICRARIRVETLGPCAADLRTLPFRHIRRPVFPLDD